MRRTSCLFAVVALMVVVGGCADEVTSPLPDVQSANAELGLHTFIRECASCHASGDGFDLAFFAFPDSTIIRRALGHVSLSEALDIVAHIRTMSVAGLSRDARAFQPGNHVLDDDVDFARGLFGADAWPEGLSTSALQGIDPKYVAVAVALPKWSVEEANLDWMPDDPLDEGILGFGGAGEAQQAYHANPSDHNLLVAVQLLRNSSRRADNPAAPCLLNDEDRIQYDECFEVQRWIASLAAQHMLRTDQRFGIHRLAHDAFWDVGQTVRRSIVRGKLDPENGIQNWASWMYVGWMFEPQNHASTYTGTGLQRVGLPRHATFVALRSMVVRGPRSHAPYKDLRSAAQFAPEHWVYEATRFGLQHLVERLESGDLPGDTMNETVDDLRAVVTRAMTTAIRKDPSVRELESLALRVLELMPAS